MKRPSIQIGLGIALGTGFGLAAAVILGSGGAWLALGIAIGVIVGWSLARTRGEKEAHG
jgi:hypothetical protein